MCRTIPVSSDGPVSFDGPTFQANIAAIRVRQPDLADRLAGVRVPADARVVTGRDGTRTIQIAATDKTAGWFGGSSMPSVSAPAVLTDFINTGTSAILPTIGTGHEPRVLADKIGKTCSAFVYEPDTASIAMALSVVDLAELIESGRAVIIDGDVEQTLSAFLAEHVGFEFPTQLHPVPGPSASELEERIAAIQRVSQRVQAARIQLADRITTEIRNRPRAGEDRTRVLVLSVDPGLAVIEHAGAISLAADKVGWNVACCVPKRPEDCSHLARLCAVRDHNPDLILFLNTAPGPLLAHLPHDLPWTCWYLESAALPAASLEGLADCPRLLAASGRVRDELIAHRARADCVNVLETGMDAVSFCRIEHATPSQETACALAVLADAQDVSPRAAGVSLESHEKLWTKMTKLLSTGADDHRASGGQASRIDEVLRRAERATGIGLTDKKMRQGFCALAGGRLVKTILTRTAVQRVLASGMDVALWGTDWNLYDSVESVHRGLIPPPPGRNAIYNSASVLLVPFLDVDGIRCATEALVAGCCPLIRRPDESTLKRYPTTGAILAALPSFANPAEMVKEARRLVDDTAYREQATTELRNRLLSEHTVANRLAVIGETLRSSRK